MRLLPRIPQTTRKRTTSEAEKQRIGKRMSYAKDYHPGGRNSKALRVLLEQTAVRDRDLDRQVAEDWLAVDQET